MGVVFYIAASERGFSWLETRHSVIGGIFTDIPISIELRGNDGHPVSSGAARYGTGGVHGPGGARSGTAPPRRAAPQRFYYYV